MARNPQYGLPNLSGSATGKPMSTKRFTDGTDRVYWAPTQSRGNRLVEKFIEDFSLTDEPYLPPSGWPVAHAPLRVPKTVLWVINSIRKKTSANEITGRGQAWWDLGLAVKASLEGTYPNKVGVIVVHDDVVDGDAMAVTFQRERWLRWATPLQADAAAGQFLGGDVLQVFVEQDFGFNEYNANEADYDPGDQATKLANYQEDYDLYSSAWGAFRRHRTWLYYDSRVVNAAEEAYFVDPFGGFADASHWEDLKAYWQAFREDVFAGSGNYAGRALSDLGWEYRGEVDYTTAAAATFVAAVTDYFGLRG